MNRDIFSLGLPSFRHRSLQDDNRLEWTRDSEESIGNLVSVFRFFVLFSRCALVFHCAFMLCVAAVVAPRRTADRRKRS